MRNLISAVDMEKMALWNLMCGSGRKEIPERVISEWENAKSIRLFKMFGDKLIYEKEVEFRKSTQEMVNEFYYERKDIRAAHESLMGKIPRNSYWVDYTSVHTIYGAIDSLLNPHELINGVTTREFDYQDGSGRRQKVVLGSKTVRAARRIFVKEYPQLLEEFDDVMQKISQLTQQKAIKGTLCLSIHPLDYMTMSDNTLGWGSCMSWEDGGEYSAGTIGCMNSTDTIVAYLKSDNDMEIERSWKTNDKFVWNNKKWRQLILVGEHSVIPNLEYPYENEDIAKEAIEWVKELTGYQFEESGREYDYNLLKVDSGVMYDDLGRSCGSWYLRTDVPAPNKIKSQLAGVAYCMDCGCRLDYNEMMICPDCGGYGDEDYDDDWYDDDED